jgi:RNA-binding protein
MTPRDKELVEKARYLRHVMAIGKSGVTEGSVNLLRRELEQKRLVKVKLLSNYLRASGRSRHDVAEELARLSGGRLVQVVGNVVVLHKAGK